MTQETHKQKKVIFFILSLVIIFISIFIISQIIIAQKNSTKLSQSQIIQEAKAHFQSMVDTRSWNAQYGGVYVKSIDGLQPNPYLKDNILLTDKNETLIKINPAWMTRQISEISNKQGLYHYKITSLKPLNPFNKATSFEKKALEYFNKNKDKKYFYNFENKQSFNFMGALPTTKACLKCHKIQGYKIGDIRGGIRVSVPLTLYNKQIAELDLKTSQSIYAVFGISLLLILLLYWFLTLFYKRQYEIEHTNELLEEKVLHRTQDLKMAISHEQHLKDILKIITEVNEMLITSYSTESILNTATEKLTVNNSYPLVITGLINDDILNIISQSSLSHNLIPQNIIALNEQNNQNFLISAIIKASKLKHPFIEKIIQNEYDDEKRRTDDINLQWLMVLPLLHNINNDVYGMITVFSSKKSGFELEEMRILENMAHDISIALYSHKQKDSILKMEKEKIANYEETILAFVNIIEQRDTYTAGHTIRVAQYCALIAKEMGHSYEEIHRLEKAAILHDIGKVATPDTILLKPGKLSQLEYELIKQHSQVGADMLEKITIYKNLAQIIRYHHSRYDGKGYPPTTSPDQISMLSHIMILADAFDAMTTNRIYRPRKSIQEALQEIKHESGSQFHPEVVKAALSVLQDINLSKTTQMPTSELEQRRMAYFFQDPLTGLYNEDYLLSILNATPHPYHTINLVDLKKFTKYNQLHGWGEGDKLLKEFAEFLNTKFTNSIIIRYHGDDFVVIDKQYRKINLTKIEDKNPLKNSGVDLEIRSIKIDQYFNFDDFKQVVN